MQSVLRGIATVVVATAALIYGCSLASIPVFTTPSVFSLIGLAVGLTVTATIVHYAIALLTYVTMKYKHPGLALPTLVGVIAGTISIWLFHRRCLRWYTRQLLVRTAFAAVVSALVWAITILFVPNPAYKERPFWPQW